MAESKSTYETIEREWLDRVARDQSQTFAVVRAILMLAAEVRDLTDIIDRRLSSLQGK